MELVWIILGIVLILVGLLGSVLPFLPGPPLCFIALMLQQLREEPPFSSRFLWIWAAITLVVVVLDYIVPAYGTKKYGGSSYGVWGCILGLIVGVFFGPIGIILGPFAGAFAGEMLLHSRTDKALRAAWGSFVGFLVGTLLKLVVCAVMAYYFVASLF